jgi:hypothetical protein
MGNLPQNIALREVAALPGFVDVMPFDFRSIAAGIAGTPVPFAGARCGTLAAIRVGAIFVAL